MSVGGQLSHKIHVVICFVGSILCLLPLFTNTSSNLESSPLRSAISSQTSREIASATLALTCPLIIDLARETFYISRSTDNSVITKVRVGFTLLNNIERAALLCGMAVIPACSLFPNDTSNLALIYTCCQKCQLILIVGAVMISLCRHNKKYWTVIGTSFSLICLVGGNILQAATDNVDMTSEFKTPRTTASRLSSILIILAVASHIWLNAFWLYAHYSHLFYAFRRKSNPGDPGSDVNSSTLLQPDSDGDITSPSQQVFISITASTVLILLSVANSDTALKGASELHFRNSVFLLYILLVSYVSIRIMRNEVVQGLCALIETKKTYVRYISHELRTPLNSAFLGLKLLSDDLERSDDEADKDRYDILSDVKSACRTSIEILNDLLCFDKLESGMLELNKQDFKILSFLSDSVKMFTSQAKEVGVSMSIILGERHDPYATRVLDSDTISMDKFKMDQVMRNLLSNAFKFTSEGGSVIVRASFIRDASSTANKHDIALKTSSKLSFSYLLSIFYGVYCYSADMLRKKEQTATVDDIEMQANHGQNGHDNDNNHHEKLDNHNHHGSLRTNDRIDLRTNETLDEESNFHLGERGTAHMVRGQSTVRNGQCDSGYKNFFSRLMRSSEQSSEGDKSDRKILSWMAGNGERANHSKNPYRNSKCDTDTVIHGKLRITVTDTGAGLTKENISRLFNEVVQFNPEILQSGGGSGLGLWITNSIVKMHSGTVCAESAGLGKGCSFTVEVDMQRRGAHTAKVPPQPHDSYTSDISSLNVTSGAMRGGFDVIHKSRGVRGSSLLGTHARMIHTTGEEYKEKMKIKEKMNIMRDSYNDSAHSLLTTPARSQALQESIHDSYSPSCDPSNTSVDGENCAGLTVTAPEFPLSPVYDILIVDDSALNRKMMKRYFTLSGHTCYEAADGKHAVSMVKERLNDTCGKRTFDAVLMDFVMPIMDGPTACKAIRALGYKGLIFGVTGNYRERDVEFFVNSGANAVLSKPFDTDKFQQCMRTMFVPDPDFATTLI